MDLQRQKALEDVFLALVRQLKEQGLSEDKLHSLLDKDDGESIPATVFATELTPLETLARYFEKKSESHKPLGRSKAAVEAILANSYSKYPGALPRKQTQYTIPLSIFSDAKRSALGHVCFYLRDHYRLRNKEIAALIGRDPRVVATVLSRGESR